MPETTGDAERLGGGRDPLDRLGELPADLRLLGVAEVEAVGERERLPACARDVERRAHHRLPPGAERVANAEVRAVERYGDPAGPVEAEHGRVEARPPHRPKAHELVELLVDPRLRAFVDGVDRRRLDGCGHRSTS